MTAKSAARSTWEVEYRVAGLSSTTRTLGLLIRHALILRSSCHLILRGCRQSVRREVHRNNSGEGRVAAYFAIDLDAPAQQFREALAERESQTGAAKSLLDGRVELHKILKSAC